jgi:hypothetical protein
VPDCRKTHAVADEFGWAHDENALWRDCPGHQYLRSESSEVVHPEYACRHVGTSFPQMLIFPRPIVISTAPKAESDNKVNKFTRTKYSPIRQN